jgi:hypothetical protein
MSGDGLPYTTIGHFKTWFFFSVKGVNANEDYTFSIRNMAFQSTLYKMGLKPVYRTYPNSMKWKRCSGQLKYETSENGQSFIVTWTHNFLNFNPAIDTVYFAWTYPYSLTKSL